MDRPKTAWDRVLDGVVSLNEGIGHVVRWFALLMVLMGAGNALLRYVGRFAGENLTSNAWVEAQWYLFSGMFLLGAAYTLHRDAHVRVDVIYQRLSERTRLRITLAGTLMFLIPFCLMMVWAAWPAVRNSWAIREMSPDPGGLPRYPIKTLIPVAFLLMAAQGAAEAATCWKRLREIRSS